MLRCSSPIPARLFLGMLAGALGAGCGKQGFDRYVPSTETAREALTAALEAWKDGQAPGVIDTLSTPVQVVDDQRRSGQQLRQYEILGAVPGEGPRCFVVRLQLDQPLEERKVRFLVTGLDPLWVFRQEDYEMLLHWCPPEAVKDKN